MANTSQFGNFGIANIYSLFGLAVIGLILIAVAIVLLRNQGDDPFRKLKNEIKTGASQNVLSKLPMDRATQLAERYKQFLEPKAEDEANDLRLFLMQAGFRAPSAIWFYHIAQFGFGALGLVIGLIYFLFAQVTGNDMSLETKVMALTFPGLIGYYGPKYWLNKRRKERITFIEKSFPDTLDLMLICIEAGQSLDQAFVRVANEVRLTCPPLADELEVLTTELKAGRDRPDVLRDLAERTGVPDVGSFTISIIQAATYGTSVSESLRIFSSEMRDKRVMRAEEQANKLPTKMSLATMGLTVPPLLVILVGPALLTFVSMATSGL